MIIKTIKNCVIFLVLIFSCARIAYANVFINEVQIAPTEERFVELYNSGSSSVDLTDWYIQRKTSTGSDFGTLVSKTYFNGKSIPAGEYFVISRSSLSNSDIVYPSLTLTESNTIQLKNSNQDLVSKIGWGSVSDCGSVCAPNPTQGKSIGRTSGGSWVIGSKTPGISNEEPSNNSSSDIVSSSSDTSTDSTVYSDTSTKTNTAILKITTKIVSPKVVVAGIPFSLSSLTTTNKGETYMVGRFVWNFGDGMNIEKKVADPFEYTYDYPGDYVLSLSYFDNYFSKIPEAINKLLIKVVPSDIYISSVGNDTDPYIEIYNKSNYEIALSGWIITAGERSFTFPEGTTIMQGKKIKLSSKITGFNGEDIKYIVITNPNKEVVTTYPTQKKVNYSDSSITKVSSNNKTKNTLSKDSQVINLNDISASAAESGVSVPSGAYTFIGLLVIILLGIVSFLFIKKKNKVKDYMDDEICPEDMTIIE